MREPGLRDNLMSLQGPPRRYGWDVNGQHGSGRYARRPRFFRRRRWLLVFLLLPLYLVVVTVAATLVHAGVSSAGAHPADPAPRSHRSAPASDPASDQGLAMANQARAARGKPPLSFSVSAAHVAQLQSLAMAHARRVFQQSCLDCTKWRMWWGTLEEDVGSGTSLQAVYKQLTDARQDRVSVLCRCVTEGGTGVVRSGGRVWVTEVFARPLPPVLLGARAAPRPSDSVITGNTDEDALLNLESEIGTKFAIDHFYQHFGPAWPFTRFAWDRAHGQFPLMDWDLLRPFYTWAQIAAGKADAIINRRARQAAAYPGPILLSFGHEPEFGVGKYGTPAQFVAAWRHVVDRFRAAGATNVSWILVIGDEVFRNQAGDLFYPGRSYVDYVAADGYNWAPDVPTKPWVSMSDIFDAFYQWSIGKRLPAMITETGVQEDPRRPGRKAAWFNSVVPWLRTHPNIKAFVYFNAGVRYPWWVDTSPQSLQAFRALAHNPLFN
jgi:Cysteine-rich secretory protein family